MKHLTTPHFDMTLSDEATLKYRKEEFRRINFWPRLISFVNNVNVNDPMSEEEKEMIISVALKQIHKD